MTPHTSDTYLKTRATVMAERLFSPERLEQMLQSSLESLGREFELDGVIEHSSSRAALNRAAEKALIQSLMLELGVLLRPLDGSARNILIHWTRKFELYNLKTLIRGKLHGLNFTQIKPYLYELPPLISLLHDPLLRTESVLELLRSLEQGPFSDIALQARRVYEEKNEPFSLDAAIDRSYYTGMLRRIRRADSEDHTPLLQLVGTLIDQQNLIWLLRYRFSYRLSPSETYYLLIPFGRQLHQERLKTLVNQENFERVLEKLPKRLKACMDGVEDLVGAERQLETETAAQAHKRLRFSQSAVTRSLAYLVLREIDLKKLFALVQGKALKLSDPLIRIAAGMEQHGQDAAQNARGEYV